jgi:hypothetical protein
MCGARTTAERLVVVFPLPGGARHAVAFVVQPGGAAAMFDPAPDTPSAGALFSTPNAKHAANWRHMFGNLGAVSMPMLEVYRVLPPAAAGTPTDTVLRLFPTTRVTPMAHDSYDPMGAVWAEYAGKSIIRQRSLESDCVPMDRIQIFALRGGDALVLSPRHHLVYFVSEETSLVFGYIHQQHNEHFLRDLCFAMQQYTGTTDPIEKRFTV